MTLKSIRSYVPTRALPLAEFVYRTYMKILCWYTGLWDRRYAEEIGTRLPPASLRYRVHGSPHIDGFLKMGKRSSENIEAALRKIGKDFDSFQNVLDFGCGCGRTLIWFANPPRSPRLCGTDIDGEAISWCSNNLNFARFNLNRALPPLGYSTETFDFIYAVSVFTHLDETYQFRWLDEIKRVTEPGGIVLLTVHGRHGWKDLPHEDIVDIRRKGFKFITSSTMKGIFPEWYQNAYHTRKYVVERYSEYFNVLDYIPKGMSNRQDVVILQKS